MTEIMVCKVRLPPHNDEFSIWIPDPWMRDHVIDDLGICAERIREVPLHHLIVLKDAKGIVAVFERGEVDDEDTVLLASTFNPPYDALEGEQNEVFEHMVEMMAAAVGAAYTLRKQVAGDIAAALQDALARLGEFKP